MSDLSVTDLIEQARELDADVSDTLAACETFYGHGASDDTLGDVDGFGHFYRVNRWTVYTDSAGFREITEHGSEREARDWWSTLEDEYSAWCDTE